MSEDRVIAGRYAVIDELGHGGMGITFLAHDKLLDRKVVLKVPAHLGMEDMFLKEARAQAAVNHSNSVKIFDIGNDGQTPFIVLELISGWNLHQLIERAGPLSSGRANHVFEPICQAVAHAHAVGIVHRDIKPSNVLIGSDDIPRLADYGIAKLPSMGMTNAGPMGTGKYMAPEQGHDASTVTFRADIYSLGVTLMAMLSGHLFPQDRSVIMKTPVEYHPLLNKCLELKPKDRYPSVEAMLEDLPDHIRARSKRFDLKEMVGTPEAIKALKDYGGTPTRKRDHVELVFNLGEVRLSGKGKKRTIVGYCHLPEQNTAAYVIRMHDKKAYDVKRAGRALAEYSPTIDIDDSTISSLVPMNSIR